MKTEKIETYRKIDAQKNKVILLHNTEQFFDKLIAKKQKYAKIVLERKKL